jgi:hypothetical protein
MDPEDLEEKTINTRRKASPWAHQHSMVNQELSDLSAQQIDEGARSVSALSPGGREERYRIKRMTQVKEQ